MKRAVPIDWMCLPDIWWKVTEIGSPFFNNHAAAVANAIRSGELPVRGREKFGYGFPEFERIDKRMNSASKIDVPSGEINVADGRPRAQFWDVAVSWSDLKRWLSVNAAFASEIEDKGAFAETCLRKWLRQQPVAPTFTKDEVWKSRSDILGPQAAKNLSRCALERAWTDAPGAWQRAGRRARK